MKKNYFMLAAAAMMFAACSETDLMSEMGEMEKAQEISFESFANKTTRAVAAPTALESYHGKAGCLQSSDGSFQDGSQQGSRPRLS